MFNQIVAALLGATAFILSVVALFRMDLLDAIAYDECTTEEYRQKDVNAFLDSMDATREDRYAHGNRKGMMRQLDGFRHEWNAYANEYSDNFELNMAYSMYA